jgi:Alb1
MHRHADFLVPSKRSRAARRATSPSIDTDKSLKRAQPPAETKPLGLHHGAGVTKRKAKAKPLSHAQRMRREKGLARAEAVLEQREVKVKKSRGREKVVKGRKVSEGAVCVDTSTSNFHQTTWEDINEDAGDKARARKKLEARRADGNEEVEMENVAVDETEAPTEAKAEDLVVKAEASMEANPVAVAVDNPVQEDGAKDTPEVKKEDAVEEAEVW